MKKMVDQLVYEVRSETKRANISYAESSKAPKITTSKKTTKKAKGITQETCPKCNKGKILMGKTAYGCSNYKNGCNFKLPFQFLNKKISENQFTRLIQKGCTVNLKGFKKDKKSAEGLIRFDQDFNLILEEKKATIPDELKCPKCKKGTILKGKTAYGCSEYKKTCDFVFSFDDIRNKANGQPLSKELVYSIINGKA